jgi:hypothetical protein
VLTWGKVAQYNDRIDFHWSQENRWYFWRFGSFDDEALIGGSGIVTANSANTHMIPADENVRKLLSYIRTGDYVKMTGYLVNVTINGDHTFHWNSSTTRTDSGAGSCEVFYVTGITWLD